MASSSMGLIEGLQDHEAFERNLRERHEMFSELHESEGEDVDNGQDGDGKKKKKKKKEGGGEGRAGTPVHFYKPSIDTEGVSGGGTVGSAPTTGTAASMSRRHDACWLRCGRRVPVVRRSP